jgi:hypothetical protein
MEHTTKLISALGNGQWKWDGIVRDAGPKSTERCACGHCIRYVFRITSEAGCAQLGSTCIAEIGNINSSMADSMRAAWAKFSKAAKAKEAAEKKLQAKGHEIIARKIVQGFGDFRCLVAVLKNGFEWPLAKGDKATIEALLA